MGCSGSVHDEDTNEGSLSIRFQNKKIDSPSIRNKAKVMTETEVHKILADSNLKAALTHPVILLYFREYMKIIGNEDILNFYLEAVELRKLYENKEIKVCHGKLKVILQKYILDSAPTKKITIKIHYRNMILQNVEADGSAKPPVFAVAMQGMKFAQYEVFSTIKEFCWTTFCGTELYVTMIKRKEVRTTISLFESFKPVSTISIADKFTAIVSDSNVKKDEQHISLRRTPSKVSEAQTSIRSGISIRSADPINSGIVRF